MLSVRAIFAPKLMIYALLLSFANADDVHPDAVTLELVRELKQVRHRDWNENLPLELVPKALIHLDIQV